MGISLAVSRGRCRARWCLSGSKVFSGVPESTLYDVSARLRFGRYQGESGHGADISKLSRLENGRLVRHRGHRDFLSVLSPSAAID
jgi:hypothetical protein